ncbi:tripartite tricarboxylate transporter substrate binding protein [Humitalea sp. 24SJ18S-53]|uniref:tripartite tricarboxylate transporter substrate binding protein n=1 Tax=Humitalea sp. 24SJ18S-53 TaxID=3422307 RepID=UPI003D674A3C
MLSRRMALALAAAPILPAAAQPAWPAGRPIEVFVGFSPGGGVDVMARAVAPFLSAQLPGSRIVIVNRPGAGGQLGHEAAASAAADGYALGATTMPGLVSHPIERPVRYRVADLTYLANVVDDPCALFVRPESPLRSLGDLVVDGRARPDILTYGLTGIGSDDHLAMFRLEAATGARLTPVPFPGIGQMLPQVFSGQVAIAAMNVSEALPFVRDGRLRGIAQAGVTRWPEMADLPTYREQGFDIVASASRGFVGPGGMPPDVTQRLIAAFGTILADPAFQAEAARLSMPLRPVLGAAYRDLALETEAELRALWQARRWTQG